MDINLWLIAHRNFIETVNGYLGLVRQTNFFDPPVASTGYGSFPRISMMSSLTEQAIRDNPIWFEDPEFKVINDFHIMHMYLFGVDLSVATQFREDIQDWLTNYPGSARAAGCWDVATGEPVGGVGSPWFVTDPQLIEFMPDVPLPPDGSTIGPSPELLDVTLLAGQAPRKFV